MENHHLKKTPCSMKTLRLPWKVTISPIKSHDRCLNAQKGVVPADRRESKVFPGCLFHIFPYFSSIISQVSVFVGWGCLMIISPSFPGFQLLYLCQGLLYKKPMEANQTKHVRLDLTWPLPMPGSFFRWQAAGTIFLK